MTGRKEPRYVGKRVIKADALEKVTGAALFGADARLPGMLHGKVLRSPHPHARIRAIDCGKALELEGVKAVVTVADLPPFEEAKAAFGGELMIDQVHLRKLTIAHDKALFEGHAIAAVAATSPEVAEAALELIQVDYELLPVVENALDAMKEGAPLLHEDLYTDTLGERPKAPSNIASIIEGGWGDVDKGFAEADVVLEKSYETQMVHQGYIEPQACLASVDADGNVTVWVSTQGTFNAQRQLSALLMIPLHKLNVVPLEIGGGFGGKIYVMLETLAILLARKSGRPVKMVMTRAEVFRGTGPGSPAYIDVKIGAKRDGHLTACYAKMILDAGAFPGSPVAGAFMVGFAPYKMPHFKQEGYDVVTNKPRVQAYRAPGGTAVAFAVESALDQVAEALGIDPLELRRINAVEEGDLMTSGQKYNRIGLKQLLERVAQHPAWTQPSSGPNRGRGLALGAWQGAVLTTTAQVIANTDGTVTVVTGQVDVTGTRTTIQQMTAELLELPLELVKVNVVDTHSAPYTDLSAGSRTTYTMSVALKNGCQDLVAHMKRLAADLLSHPESKVRPEDVNYSNGRFWASRGSEQPSVSWREVAERSRTRGPLVGQGNSGRLPPAPTFAAHVADVEVDQETGKVRLLRYTCFQEVGKAINPQQVEGQMQGGAGQGIGWGLFEYYFYQQGKLLNPTFLDYRMPTALDLPMLDSVLVEVPASEGPFGARGVGEVPIVPPAAALANAIYRAVGVRMSRLPMTPENVYWALQEKGAGVTPRGHAPVSSSRGS
ncbi:MAG: xanthine dehydrogenase family protein molybdopterin-binding subunit [Chloroflexi bacterium]|nr:xanthine dehydrogenase family protein molybdopterin-binding subunit [Chloroflexota bacterium]